MCLQLLTGLEKANRLGRQLTSICKEPSNFRRTKVTIAIAHTNSCTLDRWSGCQPRNFAWNYPHESSVPGSLVHLKSWKVNAVSYKLKLPQHALQDSTHISRHYSNPICLCHLARWLKLDNFAHWRLRAHLLIPSKPSLTPNGWVMWCATWWTWKAIDQRDTHQSLPKKF